MTDSQLNKVHCGRYTCVTAF